jgi:hypothetical protein
MPESSRAATTMRQRPKPRSSSVSSGPVGLAHEVPARDAGVRRAVGHELGYVLRAHEQPGELTAERRRQRAVAGGANVEACLAEQLPCVVGEAALVG